jgi:hypothetical protein
MQTWMQTSMHALMHALGGTHVDLLNGRRTPDECPVRNAMTGAMFL